MSSPAKADGLLRAARSGLERARASGSSRPDPGRRRGCAAAEFEDVAKRLGALEASSVQPSQPAGSGNDDGPSRAIPPMPTRPVRDAPEPVPA
eukprot:7575568-Alexandrium_andersonii.AAC.1